MQLKKIPYLIAMYAITSAAGAGTVFSDNFADFKLSAATAKMGVAGCTTSPIANEPDHENSFPPNVAYTPLDSTFKWEMFASPIRPQNQWVGNALGSPSYTKTWRYLDNVLYFHADYMPPDEGFAWISNAVFNKAKYLTVKQSISLDACVGSNSVCNVGPALIHSEADYRALYLQAFAGSNKVAVVRFASCDARALVDANGQTIMVNMAGNVDLRMDYLGAEDGGWQYWVNGTQAYININSQVVKKEPGNFLNARLAGNPRLGIYLTTAAASASPNVSGYAEGRLRSTSVDELEQIGGIGASASSSYAGSPASAALDGSINSGWNSGVFPNVNPWIELDLGSAQSLKKIRLLTMQSPAGETSHQIFAGNTPNPTTLLTTLSARTDDNQWLNVDLPNWMTARYIRIKTINSAAPNPSPAWVAWREIQVYK